MKTMILLVLFTCHALSFSSSSTIYEFDPKTYFKGTEFESFYNSAVTFLKTNQTRSKRSLSQLLGNQTLLTLVPKGTVLQTKISVDIPIKKVISYKSSFKFDAVTKINLDTFIVQLRRRKRRSIRTPLEVKKELISRKKEEKLNFYKQVERVLDSYGIPSRACLLRTLCEIAEAPIVEGLLGELLNWGLSARLSEHRDDDDLEDEELASDDEYTDYIKADKQGRKTGQCHAVYSDCNKSLFDLIPSSFFY